jgi:hypothetical protein
MFTLSRELQEGGRVELYTIEREVLKVRRKVKGKGKLVE